MNEIDTLLRDSKDRGWESRRLRNNHIQLTHVDASRPVVLPSTPSDHRGLKNAEAEMRRVLRLPATEQKAEVERLCSELADLSARNAAFEAAQAEYEAARVAFEQDREQSLEVIKRLETTYVEDLDREHQANEQLKRQLEQAQRGAAGGVQPFPFDPHKITLAQFWEVCQIIDGIRATTGKRGDGEAAAANVPVPVPAPAPAPTPTATPALVTRHPEPAPVESFPAPHSYREVQPKPVRLMPHRVKPGRGALVVTGDTLGARICCVRTHRGLSQRAFAEGLKVSCPAVSNWENNKFRPKEPLLVELCRFLKVKYGDLVGGTTA